MYTSEIVGTPGTVACNDAGNDVVVVIVVMLLVALILFVCRE